MIGLCKTPRQTPANRSSASNHPLSIHSTKILKHANRMAFGLLIGLSFLLSGCTSWYMITTPAGQPVDQNIGERTFGSKIEDMNIEAKIRANLLKASRDFRKADIEVKSFNGIVLLTGTVPNKSLYLLASKIADDTRHVRQVHNKLGIGNNLSARQKTKDNWLGLKVKTKLLTSKHVPGKRIEVVTSNGVAYLMGLLTPIETKRAVQSISYVEGLSKIVKIFEYVSPAPYAQADTSQPRRSEYQRPRQRSQNGRRVTLP